MTTTSTPSFTPRHVALARAVFAAIAALMITFSADHSAAVGLSVFSGFAVSTGLIWGLSTWLVYPSGERAPAVLMTIVSLGFGIVAGMTVWRNDALFFTLVIAWAILTGVIELVWGLKLRKASNAVPGRDAITTGAFSLLLALSVALTPANYVLDFVNKKSGETGTLTGIIIAVGLFGAYTALIAVYQGLLGLTPEKKTYTVAPGAPSDGETPVNEKEQA